MVKIRVQEIFCLLSIIIIVQSLYISFRLDKAFFSASKVNDFHEQQSTEKNLESIPEPEIEVQIVNGASLWCKPVYEPFGLEIWTDSTDLIRHVDLRIFYPPSLLEIENKDVLNEQQAGFLSWSDDYDEPKTGRFLITTLLFNSLSDKEAILEIDFTKESGMDSNLINIYGSDVLEAVDNENCRLNS